MYMENIWKVDCVIRILLLVFISSQIDFNLTGTSAFTMSGEKINQPFFTSQW